MFIPEKMQGHIDKIFCGEYNVAFHSDNPVIIDIGANVGAFTRWASARWMNSKIIALEPIKTNFEILKKNTADLSNISLYNVAVGSSDRKQKMFYGKNNEGEASLFFTNEQINEGEEVDVISASKIPNCHILKIDTEGAEIEILENLIIKPAVYLIEYHSELNRIKIDEILKNNYSIIGSKTERYNYGIVKYVKTELLK